MVLGSVALAGCALLVDLDGLSGGAPPGVTPDAAVPDAPADAPSGGDGIGLGSGTDGRLDVSAPTVVNDYAPVVARAGAGQRVVATEASAAFARGAVVMLWQTAGLESATPGDRAPFAPEPASAMGRYVLARVASSQGGSLTLDRDLPFDVQARGAQVVRVPEYTDIDVKAGGAIVGRPWDGRTGGVVALLARGTLTNAGRVHADALGFRGGPAFAQDGFVDRCQGATGTLERGFAPRGEGLASALYVSDPDGGVGQQGGAGNVVNGGGGGNCHNAGGGGGGSGGGGGVGGLSYDLDRSVGGVGGAPMGGALTDRLWLGGGGGAGHGDAPDLVGAGGAGGGVVFVRAAAVTGRGELSAGGAPGGRAEENGAGGGGAGGSVLLLIEGTADCERAVARGGPGGDVRCPSPRFAPGGGGGGGRVRVRSSGGTCVPDVRGGATGICALPDGGAPTTREAAPGEQGVID